MVAAMGLTEHFTSAIEGVRSRNPPTVEATCLYAMTVITSGARGADPARGNLQTRPKRCES